MTPLSKIFSRFKTPARAKKKPRPTVGDHVITSDFSKAKWVMIGVPDDRGVKNNFGRPGAKYGPAAFRKAFYGHSISGVSPPPSSVFDAGDFKLHKNLPQSLLELKKTVHELKYHDYSKKILVVGGGHDIAFSEIGGCLQTARSPRDHHIVNIDAHSDVRPLEKNGTVTSGTPFFRLVQEEGFMGSHYHPFGLQKSSNGQDLIEWMERMKVDIHWLENMPSSHSQVEGFRELLQSMKNKPWHLSIDMDAFSSAFAPGVSAPAFFGLYPEIFLGMAAAHKSLETLESFGIYELSPPHDESERTAKFAAKIAYTVLAYTN